MYNLRGNDGGCLATRRYTFEVLLSGKFRQENVAFGFVCVTLSRLQLQSDPSKHEVQCEAVDECEGSGSGPRQ